MAIVSRQQLPSSNCAASRSFFFNPALSFLRRLRILNQNINELTLGITAVVKSSPTQFLCWSVYDEELGPSSSCLNQTTQLNHRVYHIVLPIVFGHALPTPGESRCLDFSQGLSPFHQQNPPFKQLLEIQRLESLLP